MNNIIVDSGFWIALYETRDQHHEEANEIVEYLDLGKVIVPYPTLYELVNTRFSKKKQWMFEFDRILTRENVLIIDDKDYKEAALELTFNNALSLNRPMSLVDTVIRLMLADNNLKIDYLISFNLGDFIDICNNMNIEMLNE